MTLDIEAIKAGLEEIENTSTFEAGSDYDSADYWSRVARTQVHFTRSLIAEVERLKAKVEKDKATMKRLTTTIQNRAESLNDQRREYRNLLRKRDSKIERLQKLQEIETFNKEAAWKDVAQKREWLDEASKLLEEAREENERLQRVIDNVESVKHRLVQELEVGLSVGSRMIVSDLEEALEELA